MSAESLTPPRAKPCPLCGKPAVAAFRPFCSRGCRDRDLIGWFSEDYRIPGPPENDPDGEAD
jgi:hypothetical protein